MLGFWGVGASGSTIAKKKVEAELRGLRAVKVGRFAGTEGGRLV